MSLAPYHHDAGGILLLAGLEWQAEDGSTGAGIIKGMLGGSRITWRGARAFVRTGPLPTDRAGALLAEMCLAAERQGRDVAGLRVWVAKVRAGDSDPEDGPAGWWMGGTDDGVPSRTVPEDIHATLPDLVRALAGISATCDLAGIGVCKASAEALILATRARGPELPEPVICTLDDVGYADAGVEAEDNPEDVLAGDMPQAGGPRFIVVRRMTPAMLALAGVLAVGVTGLAAWSAGLLGASPEPVAASLVAQQKAAGRIACRQGLTLAWPRMPGWNIIGSGCARSGHLQPDLRGPGTGTHDLVIWRSYHREAGANAVLAEAAAKRLVAGWVPEAAAETGHIRSEGSEDRLTLWRRVQLPTEAFEPTDTNLAEITRRLAETFADEPGAVSRSGAVVTVEVSDPPGSAFDRLEPARGGSGGPVFAGDHAADTRTVPSVEPDIELLSVTWTGQLTTMHLRARSGDVL